VPPSVSLLQEAKVEDLMLPLLPMEKDFLVKVLW
jgi:hypothetical protein